MTPPLTIAICARNAAATIERAVASCLPERDCALLLVDDHCTDDTVARARQIGGHRVKVVEVAAPGGLSRARQAGLDRIGTPFAAWLDADDEWVSGRAKRLVAMLEAGHDVAADAIDLVEGTSGTRLRRLSPPPFLADPGGEARLFERNSLPGDSQAAFGVSAFRSAGGFDVDLEGPESYDILLRVIRAGGRFTFDGRIGYRMHAYPGSLSRNVVRSRGGTATVLRKHDYDAIERLYLHRGHSPLIARWALVAVAMFRGEPAKALSVLAGMPGRTAHDSAVLELEGPWPVPENWRYAFYLGTALLMSGDDNPRALDALAHAERLLPTAEGANNHGVALARAGRPAEAREAFTLARRRFSGYLDAALNLASGQPDQITTHPLRRIASRSEYPGLQAT